MICFRQLLPLVPSASPIGAAHVKFTSYETSDPESPGGTGNARASYVLGIPNRAQRRNALVNNPRRVGGGFVLPGSMEGEQTIAVLSLAGLALRGSPRAVLCAH
jgi:hypothetical protein